MMWRIEAAGRNQEDVVLFFLSDNQYWPDLERMELPGTLYSKACCALQKLL